MARPIDREKRRDLAMRAVDALQKLGLEASMTQLAAELGVKRPTLLYHFPNRAAIVEAALGEILAEQATFIIERMEQHAHPIDQLYAQIRGVYEFHYGTEARVLFLSQMVVMAGAERTANSQVRDIAIMMNDLRSGLANLGFNPQQVEATISTLREKASTMTIDELFKEALNTLRQ